MKKIKWIVIILIAAVSSQYLCRQSILKDYNVWDCYELKNFPILKQPDDISCGVTCAAMVLQYYNKPVSIEEVSNIALTQKIGMTLPILLGKAMKVLGLNNKIKTYNIKQLKINICNNDPVIVLLRSSASTWHYVVVIGYDESNIIVADPWEGQIMKIDNKTFEESWSFCQDMDGLPTKKDLYRFILFLFDVSGHLAIVRD